MQVEHMTAKQYNAKYGTNFKKNKFNAKRCEIGDQKFDSTSEGDLWWQLKQQEKAGLIKSVIREPKEALKGENGTFICNYYPDFLVTHNDGTLEYIEHKGICTDLFKTKWAMFLDKYKKEIQQGKIKCSMNWYKPKYNYFKNIKKR